MRNTYRLSVSENNGNTDRFLLIVVGVCLFMWFVYPTLVENFKSENFVELYSNNKPEKKKHKKHGRKFKEDRDADVSETQYFLNDGANRTKIVHHNLCSKSCCSTQYPPSFNLKHDPLVCKSKGKYVPSNIFCNNVYQDSGCLCLTKNQATHLASRGNNGY